MHGLHGQVELGVGLLILVAHLDEEEGLVVADDELEFLVGAAGKARPLAVRAGGENDDQAAAL